MAINIAQKRAKKAQKRKLVVAEKRRAEALEAGLPARIHRASQMPIQHCLLTDGLFDGGLGTLIVARGASLQHVTFGSFLIDPLCLGIKDVTFESLERDDFDAYLTAMDDAGVPMISVDPSYARKLVRDLAAWSKSIGFLPHRDFAVIERIFGDVSADASDATFEFGDGGKPIYVSGIDESEALTLRRLDVVEKYLRDNGLYEEDAPPGADA